MWLKLTKQRYKRTIRHEFGHALGMKHEHQYEGAPPLYDEQKLAEYLKEVMFGDNPPENADEKVASKINKQWKKLAKDPTCCSDKYDKDSVMHYICVSKI